MPVCPFLNAEERCSIYEARPECCRNFPQHKDGTQCLDKHRCTYKEGILNCAACTDKCCKHISVSNEGALSQDDFLKALNITCGNCNQVWK